MAGALTDPQDELHMSQEAEFTLKPCAGGVDVDQLAEWLRNEARVCQL
jgi:hypothetical protein